MYKALLDSDFYYFKLFKTGAMDNPSPTILDRYNE